MEEDNPAQLAHSDGFSAYLDIAYASLTSMSGWELIAVLLAIAYLLLALKERIECWYAAFASTLIYLFLFWDVSLLMESALQLYYLAMAVYGWRVWHKQDDVGLPIKTWSGKQHISSITVILAATAASGYWLDHHSQAALPYLDSFTTWGAIITTYMVTQKVLENWLYWIVIDGVAIYLYWDRALYLTAILFVLYVIIAFVGYSKWKTQHQLQMASSI